MAARLPVIRHFIACEQIEQFPDERRYTLHKIIYAIRALRGTSYPRIQPAIDLFAVLTDGHGAHRFSVDLVTWDNAEERSNWTSREVIMDLGQDPLTVYGWPIHLANIPFHRSGLYEFRLVCDGEVIAREPLLMRESL